MAEPASERRQHHRGVAWETRDGKPRRSCRFEEWKERQAALEWSRRETWERLRRDSVHGFRLFPPPLLYASTRAVAIVSMQQQCSHTPTTSYYIQRLL